METIPVYSTTEIIIIPTDPDQVVQTQITHQDLIPEGLLPDIQNLDLGHVKNHVPILSRHLTDPFQAENLDPSHVTKNQNLKVVVSVLIPDRDPSQEIEAYLLEVILLQVIHQNSRHQGLVLAIVPFDQQRLNLQNQMTDLENLDLRQFQDEGVLLLLWKDDVLLGENCCSSFDANSFILFLRFRSSDSD